MRLKVHPMLKGSTRTTLHHPMRQHMNMKKNTETEVFGESVREASEGDPVRRATEKLKYLSIKKSRPVKKYITLEG